MADGDRLRVAGRVESIWTALKAVEWLLGSEFAGQSCTRTGDAGETLQFQSDKYGNRDWKLQVHT